MKTFYQNVSCEKGMDCQFTRVNFVEKLIFSFMLSYLWAGKKIKIEVEIRYKVCK